ncbi:MAG TPA: DUF222 domain-containing protein [Steroidobacteraceae bacterium]|nr:DUF222 domain-containing protein [Steroidobacteraceae bacterium]
MDATVSFPEAHLSNRELEAQITELAGHLNAANYRLLSLIAEFDRRNGWSDWATQSCAHWLNYKCGIDLGAARERVRVAHALEKLPQISAAMARGELSYSKVRAMTRIACSENEAYLLSIALHGTASHVENLVRHYRRAKEAEELSREARQQAGRCVSCFFDDDGSLVIKARLPAEAGALLLKAFDAAMREIPPIDVSAETPSERPSIAVRRADAVAILAESFLAHGACAANGGDRNQIIVHVDAETLRHGCAGRCELEHGPALAAESARRLACDASVIAIVEDENGDPLSVGRKTRSLPPAIRRALQARDRGCRFPGCPNTRYVDGHHIRHWADGGETRLSNLVSLCRFHHRCVHEGKVSIQVLDDGAVRFVAKDRSIYASDSQSARPSDYMKLSVIHHASGIHIDASTARSRWRGEAIDYGLAVEALLQRATRSPSVSAESSPAAIG